MEVETDYGTIHRVPGCKDDYVNLVTYVQPAPTKGGSGIVITLQRPAMRSFQEAEEALARKPWRPGMPRKVTRDIDPDIWRGDYERTGKRTFRPIPLTGSLRTCEQQARLYALNGKDGNPPNRYAPPTVGVHTHGLAIDVHTGWLAALFRVGVSIRRVLSRRGWNQSRPDDEPWHFSFGVTA